MRLIRYRDDHRESMLALHRSALVGIPLGMSQQEDEADLMAIEQVYLLGTRWMCLDELVNEHCGILIEPRDSSGLLNAMVQLMSGPELFQHLRRGARERSKEFSSQVWTERFIDYCRQALINHRFG